MRHLPFALAVAGLLICTALWLTSSAREISRRHGELNTAGKQLALYSLLCAKARDSFDAQRTAEQAELSLAIYQSVAQEYNRCIAKPQNRPVARILGFRPAFETRAE